MYNKELFTSERLQFIIKNCSKYLKISLFLLKKLMKDNTIKLLNIIFKSFKFYDILIIKTFLFHYKNKQSISIFNLNRFISSEEYI